MKNRFILAFLLAFVMLFCGCQEDEISQPANENLLNNPGFEESQGTEVSGWTLDRYDNSSPIEYYLALEDATAPEGKNVLKIESVDFNDARFVQEVAVVPNAYYRLSAKIKTEIVEPRKADSGAHIGFLQTYSKSGYIRSNAQWTDVVVYGKTSKDTSTVKVALRLGDYAADAAGVVYFDDVSLMRVESLPDGVSAQSMDSFEFAQPNEPDNQPNDVKKDKDKIITNVTVTGIILFLLLATFLFLAYKFLNMKMYVLFIFVGVAFIIRLIASVCYAGFLVDINCFAYWGNTMAQNGIKEFYSESFFCDYPPLYMMVLGIVSSIANLFGIDLGVVSSIKDAAILSADVAEHLPEGTSWALLLLKSPAMICDALAAIFLALIAKKRVGEKIAVLLGIGYALFPTAVVNSALWGQVDSVLVLFMLLTFWLIDIDQFGASVVTFAIGLLFKPQAILFGPVMLLAMIHEFYLIVLDFIKRKTSSGVLRLVKGFGGFFLSVGIFIWLAIVMKNGQPDVEVAEGIKVNWLLGKYLTTLGSYDYATLSSFGLMGALDGQWVPSSQFVYDGVTYGQLGTALIWVVAIGVFTVFGIVWGSTISNGVKKKDVKGIPTGWFWLLASLMVAGAVTFSTRTHERYMFPVILMTLMSFVHFKDIKLLFIALGYGLLNFINTAGLLFLYEGAGVYFDMANNDVVTVDEVIFNVGSILIVLLFLFYIYVTITLMLKKETPNMDNSKTKMQKNQQQKHQQQQRQQYQQHYQQQDYARPDNALQKLLKRRAHRLPKVTLKDILICFVITAVYACVAFTDLGDIKAAQNFWYAEKSEVYAIADLGEVKDFDSIKYLSQSNTGIVKFYTSEDGENYDLYQTLAVSGDDTWKDVGQSGKARYIKLEASSGTNISELVILKDDKPLEIKATSEQVVPINGVSGDADNLFDDQECYNRETPEEIAPATSWASGGNFIFNFTDLVSLYGAEVFFDAPGEITFAVQSSMLSEDSSQWTDVLIVESTEKGWASGTLLVPDEYLTGNSSVLVKNPDNVPISEIQLLGVPDITIDAVFDMDGNFIERTHDIYSCFDEPLSLPNTSTVTKGNSWGISTVADYVIADFGAAKNIDRGYYRTSLTKGTFSMYYSADGENWDYQNNFTVEESNLYYWHNLSTMSSARYVLITADTPFLKLVEIGFFESKDAESTIPIEKIIAYNEKESGGKNLFDEQELVPKEGATYMNSMYFDEIYHARTAYESANGHSIYEWTHPPLGKDMMSWCVSLMGMTPFAWRFAGTLAGVLMIPAFYFLGLLMFKKTSWASATALLLAFDGMHYVQTRIATIDTFGVLFIILMFLFMYWYYSISFYDMPLWKTFIPLGLCGISFGLGAASKWICLYAGAGLAVIFFIVMIRRWYENFVAYDNLRKVNGEERKYLTHIVKSCGLNTLFTLLFCIGVFIIIPLIIYCLSYYPYWNAESETRTWYEIIISNQEAMFSYHSNLEATHPYQSDWYTWPVMKTPMFYYAGPQDAENMSAIYAFGNPIVWYAGLFATIAGIGICFSRLFTGKIYTSPRTINAKGFLKFFGVGDENDPAASERDTWTLIFLILGVACNLMPWMGINRCIFIYHYFATVPFIILFTVYLLRYIARYEIITGTVLTITLVVLAGIAFFMFLPIWTGTTVSREYVGTWLHWQDGWFGYYFPN